MKSVQPILITTLAFISGTAFADEKNERAIEGYSQVCELSGGQAGRGTPEFVADPAAFAVVDSKISLNENQSIAQKFSEKPEAYLTKAEVELRRIEMQQIKNNF